MRTLRRPATILLLGLALVAGACSSGGDEAGTTPITPIPVAASPDTAGLDLTDLLAAPETASTTITTSAVGRAEAESFVREFLTVYFEASAARDWDAVYAASSQAFAGVCPAEEFAQLTSSFAADPSSIEFLGDFEVSVVGDFATGRVEITDEGGTLPIEGLLAVVEADGWRVAINPCDVAAKVASGDFSYPIIITTTTSDLDSATPSEDAGATPSDAAPIPDALTTTTTTPGATTTTTIAGTPLTAADRTDIESVLKNFVTADAAQDWVALYASVPPLFACTPAETEAALSAFHFSPTAVAFGPMTITGADDEAVATFDVTYLDSFETVTITEFGAWEWGGVWYAAVHPCTGTDNLVADGSANTTTIELLEDTLFLARALYAGAGDYDIPTSALNEITSTSSFVENAAEAGPGVVAYDDADQEVLIVTQSGSGRWYCIAEDAGLGAHYGSAFYLDTVDTLAGCRSVSLAVAWSAL